LRGVREVAKEEISECRWWENDWEILQNRKFDTLFKTLPTKTD
jgi:hypothetical protein